MDFHQMTPEGEGVGVGFTLLYLWNLNERLFDVLHWQSLAKSFDFPIFFLQLFQIIVNDVISKKTNTIDLFIH